MSNIGEQAEVSGYSGYSITVILINILIWLCQGLTPHQCQCWDALSCETSPEWVND